MTREKYEKKFTDSVVMVQQRDTEVFDLKARLEKSEAKNAGLLDKVSALELVRRELDGKVAQLTADCDGLRDQVVAGLDVRIADVRHDMENDLYPHKLTAIAGRRWVVGHGFCLAVHKCARSIECHSALGKVISMAINKGIQHGLEARVVHEGLKDSSLTLIMTALTLKDDHGYTDATPEFFQFQPSLDQVIVPIYSKCGSIDREILLSDSIPSIRESAERRGLFLPLSSTLGRASSSAPPRDLSLGVVDYQVSTLVLFGDGGST
nr:hypothetical protein [Tanacetum cinerariifolium]